jgi:hypothetical protein
MLVITPNKKAPVIDENPIFNCSPKAKKPKKSSPFPLEGDHFNENRKFLWTYTQTHDVKAIEKLFHNHKFTNPFQQYSADNPMSLLDLSISNKDNKLFSLCLK